MNTSRTKGFTLIEMIISVGLFSIVAVIAASAYLNLVDIDRRTRASSDLVNNMTFVMNSMASNIRTGNQYACVPGDANGNGTCNQLNFIDANGCSTSYTFGNGGINETQTGVGCTNNGRLTDPALTITDMHFTVVGNAQNGDVLQPQVMIYITGSMPISTTKNVSFTVQTTAVQRGIDLPTLP